MTTINFIGIDPSQRHTGLCLLTETGPSFYEISPKHDNILDCLDELANELSSYLAQNYGSDTTICVERQLSVGAKSSSLMFLFQMAVLSMIKHAHPMEEMRLIMPLPIQLKSYMIKVHGLDTSKKSTIVAGYKAATGQSGRISSHKVDAYYLARLGRDVSLGSWRYNKPSKEAKLFAGTILNGDTS